MNELSNHDVIIPDEYYGMRFDVALSKLYPDYSRSQLSSWLKEGVITLNGKIAKPKDKVFGKEQIAWQSHLITKSRPANVYQPEDIPLDILYEDDEVLVINKPAGLVVHPGAGNREHTLVNALLHHDETLSHLPRAGIVHRLDKDTTGALLIAKTHLSHAFLVKQLQERAVKRQYLALVYGHLISGRRIETCYGRHPHNRLKMAVREQGKEALTQFTLNKQYQYVTLLDVVLQTGRTHQIRVHMAHINHPIVGDTLYGGRTRIPAGISPTMKQALLAFPRQALHACQLAFTHPMTHKWIEITAKLPDDFHSLIQILEHERDLSIR